MLRENRSLKHAVGIGIDASSKVTGRKGGSEAFYALEVDAWTPDRRLAALIALSG